MDCEENIKSCNQSRKYARTEETDDVFICTTNEVVPGGSKESSSDADVDREQPVAIAARTEEGAHRLPVIMPFRNRGQPEIWYRFDNVVDKVGTNVSPSNPILHISLCAALALPSHVYPSDAKGLPDAYKI